MRSRALFISVVSISLLAGGGALVLSRYKAAQKKARLAAQGVPVGVLGDSDSHIYRDPVHGVERGGRFHDVTYQWTEILDRLRPAFFDFGPKGRYGTRRIPAVMGEALGLEARTPLKYDFKYNFAISGLGCKSLLDAWPEQARWLVDDLEQHHDFWKSGIVVIRIGMNDIGQHAALLSYAEKGLTDAARRNVRECTKQISDATRAIRNAHDTVRIVLVGIADNTILAPPDSDIFQFANARDNIVSVLDLFDDQVQKIADQDDRTVFMEDRKWFKKYWPDTPDETGGGLYLGGKTPITKTKGDNPRNIALEDNHAGTVVNGLWARELVRLLNREFNLAIPEIRDAEIARLVDERGILGIAEAP